MPSATHPRSRGIGHVEQRRPRRAVALATLTIVAMLAAGCSEHSVGPARTYDDYERKSRTSAEVALSAVETVRLLAETSTDGNAWGAYTSVSLSEQEDTLAATEGDFASIQPPDHRSDDLRATLLELLGAASDHIAAVRIEARRGNLGSLADAAVPLAADSAALQQFLVSIER